MPVPVLPDVLYIQDDGRELVVNRTPVGALNRNLGYWRTGGEAVGIYKLDRMVSLEPTATVQAVEITPVPLPVVVPQQI